MKTLRIKSIDGDTDFQNVTLTIVDTPTVNLSCDEVNDIPINQKILLHLKVSGKSTKDFGGSYKMQLIPSDNNIKLSTSEMDVEKGWNLKTYIECSKEIKNAYLQVKINGKEANKIYLNFKNNPKDVFSEKKITEIKEFLKENAGKYDTASHMDCITTVNHTLKLLYADNNLPTGSQMTGKDLNGRLGTMDKLSSINKVKSQFTIEYKDTKGRICKKGTPYKAEEMAESLADKIDSMVGNSIGYHIFGIAIMDGYHSMLLTVDNNNPCSKIYILSDQNPINSNYNYTNGWKEFANGKDLDDWITHKTKVWHSKKDSYAGTKVWKLQK